MNTKLTVLALALCLSAPVVADTVKGRIKYISNKANTIQIDVKGQPAVVVHFDASTKYKDVEGIKKLSPPDLIKVEYEPGKPATMIKKIVFGLPQGVEIGIQQLVAILQKKEGPYVLGDARPFKKYLSGHVPSSISTPVSDEGKFLKKLPADKKQLLVFYCGGPTCPFTAKAVEIASKAGYTNIKGFQEGIPGWKKAKLPVHANRGWVSKNLDMHHVVLDVREADKAAAEHLAGAVSMPVTQLTSMTENFAKTQKRAELPGVTDKRAPIILYAETHASKTVLLAFKELRSWGYKNITILEGGLNAWKADGLPVVSNQLATGIKYTKKLAKGAITPSQFMNLHNNPVNTVFVDVRTEAEIATHGALKGSRHIPLDSLEAKVGELPKDKEIILYCENGIRAEMAYSTLAKHGLKARFLNETPRFDEKGDIKFQ